MSSVLKALKKLEEERRGDAAASGSAAGQRWSSGGQPPQRPRFWLLAIGGLAIGLLVALALLWPKRSEPPVATVTSPAETLPPMVAAPAPAPTAEPVAGPVTTALAPPARVEPVEAEVADRPALAAAIPVSRPAPPPPSIAPPVVAAPSPAPPPVASAVREQVPAVRQETQVRQVQVNRFDIPSPGQQWVAPPQLTVTEIFPPAGGERMAIVNGLPVMVGTMVEEAMVEEIHDDRVIISISGKQVSVPLQRGR